MPPVDPEAEETIKLHCSNCGGNFVTAERGPKIACPNCQKEIDVTLADRLQIGCKSMAEYAENACEHCGEFVNHQAWCITKNSNVYEAFEMVANPGAVTKRDEMIMHALGIRWNALCQC